MASKHNDCISVIMPIFNGATHLVRAVESVLKQKNHNWQLVVVDDASTDNTFSLVSRYSKHDPRIEVYRLEKNSGPSAARNYAFRHLRGDMLAYLDCDDEFYPDYLDNVQKLRKKGDVLVFGYDAIDETGIILGPGGRATWEPAYLMELLFQGNIACPLGISHRRQLLQRAGLFDERLFALEDWDLWKRFALAGAEFIYLPLKSGLYHVRGDSLSRSGRMPEMLAEINKMVISKNWNPFFDV